MDEVSGRIVLFGGVYNNHLALAALLDDAPSRASEIFCLGDVGASLPRSRSLWNSRRSMTRRRSS